MIQFNDPWNFPVFQLNSLDEEEWERMKEDIGETEEKRKECMKGLIKKLKEKKDFIPCLDETFLLGYLRICKFDISRAYERILNFYHQMSIHLDTFKIVAESAVQKAKWFHDGYASPIRMKDNSVLATNKYFLMDPEKISFEEVFYLNCLIFNQFAMHPALHLSGMTVIADFDGCTVQKMLLQTPSRIARNINMFQNTFPCRFKAIHLINVNAVFSVLYKMALPFLSKKIRNRMFVHARDEKYKSLHSVIPPELLPEEYGGHIKQSEMIGTYSTVKEMSEEFQKQLTFGFVNKKDSI